MDDNACVFILLITKQINTEKQLNGVKHCVRRQITFLNLQQSFCDSVHLVYYEYNKKIVKYLPSHRQTLTIMTFSLYS